MKISRLVSSSVQEFVKGRSRVVAAILIVGDEPVSLETLADLLLGWQVSTSDAKEAVRPIRCTLPDLLIFCQSVPDERADELIERARELNPNVRSLGICRQGETRNLNAELYEVRLNDPGYLRIVVARLLQSSAS
jgi:response regulator RpfG family c-di-GMP phosphodiesterase